jgi:hypothetical protein
MAKVLSKSNIANSNIIEAWQVSQSVDAFTGIVDYDITISGSLTVTGSARATSFTGSLLGTASYALRSLNSTSASYAVTSSYSLNSTSASYVLSASYASTSSWATNVINSPATLDGWLIPSGSTITVFPVKILAGYAEIAVGATSTVVNLNPAISSGVLGTDVFVSVGISSSYTTGSMVHFPRAASLTAGNLTFSIQSSNASAITPFFFTIMYK